MRQRALCLLQGHLERPRVDLREEIALLDDLAFLEPDLGQLAADLRLHRHRIERCHRAQLVQDDADVAFVDGGGTDRLGRGLGGSGGAGVAAGLGCMVSPPVPAEAQACSDDNAQDKPAAQPRLGMNPRFTRHWGRFDLVLRSVYALIHRLLPRSIRPKRIHLIPGR